MGPGEKEPQLGKKVLITGGAGYLGGALTNIIRLIGNQVRVYDSLVYEDSYRKKSTEYTEFIYGDVRDYDKLQEHLDWADCVVWLAGIVGDGACALNPMATIEVNYDAVKYLSEHFDGRIIFMSTCSVYGAQDGLLTEDSSINPLSLYAKTKLMSEELLKDKNAAIFRLGTLYGLGDDYSRIRLDLVVNTLTSKAVSEGKLKVFGGEQYRPLLHVKDAAMAIVNELDHKNHNDVGIFNLHGENMRIIDLAELVASEIPGTDLEIVETSFEDSRNYRVDSTKSQETFSFKTRYNVHGGIIEVKELLQSGRIKDLSNPRYTNQGFLSASI